MSERKKRYIFRFIFAAIFFIAAATGFAQTRPPFVLETIEAQSGERATGFVNVPAGVDEGTQIPVSIERKIVYSR